jgi:NAD+-dependent secondary alcohol dehydrogenase Adh1
MRAIVMRQTVTDLAPGFLVIGEIPTPRLEGPFDVIVEIAAAGVCRSDLHLLRGELPVAVPHVLGHENAGRVHATGSLVTTVAPGDPVLCYPFSAGGLSPAERRGIDSAAPDRITPGIDAPGGYAEYVRVSERAVIPLPDDADLVAMATLTDAGLAAYRACHKAAAHLRPGGVAVVIGVGGLGHLAIQILRALSPASVVAVDTREGARRLGLALGADVACAPGEVAEVVADSAAAVIDFVGSDATARLAIDALGFGGAYFIVGVGGSITMPTLEVVAGEVRIEGVYVGTYPELVELVALASAGDVVPTVTTYALEDAERALRDLDAGRIVGRAVLVP